MNKSIMMGRVVNEPDLRYTQTEVIREKLKKDGFITSMGCNNYLWISW